MTKHSFVIDVDHDGFLRVMPVERTFGPQGTDPCKDCTRHVNYHRSPEADSVVCAFEPDGKFLAKLGDLLDSLRAGPSGDKVERLDLQQSGVSAGPAGELEEIKLDKRLDSFLEWRGGCEDA